MEYEKCLVQLDSVLDRLNIDELNKIPLDFRQKIKEKKDKNYTWEYDGTKKLTDQDLDRKTIIMISYINMEYLLTDEQKKLMEDIHRMNEKMENKKKQKNFETRLFNEKGEATQKVANEPVIALVETKKDAWYKRIFYKIRELFKK